MLLLIGLGYAIPKYYLVDTKVAANDSCHNDKVSAGRDMLYFDAKSKGD